MSCLNKDGKFSPHPGQFPKFDPQYDNFRVVADVAGSGGGKSLSGAWWMLGQVRKNPYANHIIMSADHTTLSNATLPTFQHVFEDIYQLGNYLSSKKTFQIKVKGKNAGKIFFGSGENPYAMEGAHVQSAWLDEAGRMPYLAWEVAQRRTRFHQGKILITTTPYATNWLKTQIYDRAKLVIHHFADANDKIIKREIKRDLDTNILVSQFDSIVNPTFPMDEYIEARATMPSWRFKMFYKGEFERPPSMIYDNFDDNIHVIEDFDIPEEWRRNGGIDWGTTHPTACLWLATSPELYVTPHGDTLEPEARVVYREYNENEKYPRFHIEKILKINAGEHLGAIYSDPARPDAIEEMNEYWRDEFGTHRNWIFAADNNVDAGISLVYGKFAQEKLYIARSLKYTIDQLFSYQYQLSKDGITVLEKPQKENDDLVDALRYAEAGIKIGNPTSKFSFGAATRFNNVRERLGLGIRR